MQLCMACLLQLAFSTTAFAVAMKDPCTNSSATGPAPDHSVFTAVLKDVVVFGGTAQGITTSLVNYTKLREEPAALQKYMLSLCSVDVAALSINAQFALWANAYNALMLSIIVHYNPATSVRDISKVVSSGKVWKEMLGTVGGQKVSLDIIEHTKIRSGSPSLAKRAGISGRTHSALVCASLSCPDLQREAFEASTLVAQVTATTRKWLMNPSKNPGPDGSGGVVVSKIFDWYGGDFVAEMGSIPAFLRNNSDWTKAQVPDGSRVTFAKYNWGLNVVGGAPPYSGHAVPVAVGVGVLAPLLALVLH